MDWDGLVVQRFDDQLRNRRLTDSAGAVDGDQDARQAVISGVLATSNGQSRGNYGCGGHTGINGSRRLSAVVTGQTSASTVPIRSPAEITAAGQPFPQEPAMPQDRQVALPPICRRPVS
jgi:hypothetical protein